MAIREALVRDVMSKPVATIGSGASAQEAAAVMDKRGFLHLVVVDDRDRVVGIVSDRDVRAAEPSLLLVQEPAMRAKALAVMRVDGVMTARPHTVQQDLPVRDALRHMQRYRIGSLPVVDDQGHPVGIVTGGDIITFALGLLDEA